MNNQLTDPQAPVTERELDQLIWGLERYGLYPRQLAALKELQEVRMANAEKLNQPVSETEALPSRYLQGHQDALEWAAQMAEANHPQTGDWLYDDPISLAAAIRKGPDMPEFKSVSVDEDDNFYSWFGRFWHENYQQNNYTTSAKQMLGTMAEFAYRAGRESAARAGNSPVTQDGWIPVSERMPEDEQEVLTRNRMGHCFVSFFDEHSGLFFDRVDVAAACCIEHILVTHWMPLPAAPQQDVRLALEIGMSRYAGAMQKLVDSGD